MISCTNTESRCSNFHDTFRRHSKLQVTRAPSKNWYHYTDLLAELNKHYTTLRASKTKHSIFLMQDYKYKTPCANQTHYSVINGLWDKVANHYTMTRYLQKLSIPSPSCEIIWISLALSLSLCPYHPSLLVGLPNNILSPQRANVIKSLLIGQHWHVHVLGSIEECL